MVKHPKYGITSGNSFGTCESKIAVSYFGTMPFVSIKGTSSREITRWLR
jgi:hypothetical protein